MDSVLYERALIALTPVTCPVKILKIELKCLTIEADRKKKKKGNRDFYSLYKDGQCRIDFSILHFLITRGNLSNGEKKKKVITLCGCGSL